jgi:2-oxoglutarate ferredoxin oxidoreductase subunit beta
VFPTLGIPREKFVIVSGIGCASRFPYYMNTYGFHTIHGRAPAIATGVHMANPDLSVWVVSGDGDALSIGGNHLIHAMRRNVDIKVLMFNNRIYGLTKGQASPTSELDKRTKSTPFGSTDQPLNPLSLALGANASFVARSIDVFAPHLKSVLQAAAAHRGSAFIEIYQNCNIFNDKAFHSRTERSVRDDQIVQLEDGQPVIFGRERNRGIRLNGLEPEVVEFGETPPEDLLVWNASSPKPTLPFLMAQLDSEPGYPLPIGVFRNVRGPTYEDRVHGQIEQEMKRAGSPGMEELLQSGQTWDVS